MGKLYHVLKPSFSFLTEYTQINQFVGHHFFLMFSLQFIVSLAEFINLQLWELKRDHYEQASNQIMEKQVDRYREQLGRRENFTVHAVFVVLSYIIFGLVPPLTYGFSFRKSDDKELKIVSVAAASLVCILMLAIGKAYVQRAPKPYFKTLSAYVILGFTVSGVSYAAGILFKRLLEKLGLFEHSSTVNLFLPETGPAWVSL